MTKRATSLNKKKAKKIITSKFIQKWQDKLTTIIEIYGRRLLVQIGYKCGEPFSVSKDKTKRKYLVLSCIALALSVASAMDTELRSLIESVVAVALLCIECKLEHEDLIKNYKPPNDEIPTEERKWDIRTPVGTKLVIYIFIAFFGFLAFLCSSCEDGWLISLMLFVIELIDTVITALVVYFNAEA